MTREEIISKHRAEALKVYPAQTLAAIARRIERGKKVFRIGTREYYANEMGVHYYSLGAPFCIHYHELPLDSSCFTKYDEEIIDLALKNTTPKKNESRSPKKRNEPER